MRSFIAAVCGLLLAVPAFADSTGVTVTGQGKVTVVPDAAQVTVGVVSRDKDAGTAVKLNNKSVSDVLATVKKLGVEDKDVQTVGFSLSQEYSDTKTVVPVGFVVSNQVTVTVRNLDDLGKVLNSVVAGGANSVQGVHFLSTTQSDFLDKARKEAMADAKRKALLYADAAGAKLGAVTSVSESDYSRPSITSFSMRAEAGDVPVARGQNTVSVKVTTTWSLDNQ